jgi:NTP pyrophosphatase (non-canonical NTP hydrolase)
MRSACRANEEMAELLSDLSLGHYAKAGEEIADIILCLHGVTAALGINIAYEVDRKMEINRKRKWRISDQGHGYHVKD